MDFEVLEFDPDYRSSTHLLGRDFLGRVLRLATRYDRAVAFFSSTIFTAFGEDFEDFFLRGGTMRLIVAPHLSARDIVALRRTYVDRHLIIRDERSLESLFAGRDSSLIMAHLLVRGLLRIKVAQLRSEEHHTASIYHEKIGVLRDAAGRTLAFSGSTNESRNAWSGSFERVDVFPGWGPQEARGRASRVVRQFEELWNNSTEGLRITDISEVFLHGHIEETSVNEDDSVPSRILGGLSLGLPPESLFPDPELRLMDHQTAAIRQWGNAGGRGIFEMATGSGKTLTALSLTSRLYDRLGPGLLIVVIAPYIHLVDQWIQTAQRFGLKPVRCAEGRNTWYEELSAGINALNSGLRPVLSVATTIATLCGSSLQELIRRVRRPLLLIADEAHNYGAEESLRALPENATFRLGLSATPERWGDEEGTKSIIRYFGDKVFSYGLEDALRDGVLTPYRYHPVLVDLSDAELQDYLRLTSEIGRRFRFENKRAISDSLRFLLIARSRLIASAERKLPVLRSLLEPIQAETHILVYCGDGQVEGTTPDVSQRQIEAAVRMIGKDLKMRCASYTAETPPRRRREILEEFARGEIQVLVAIRCLDEGVDVPATRKAFILASSTNPRQYVQRRGRVLRRSVGKERADIFDFFVAPPFSMVDRTSLEFGVMRRLFAGQIRRASEFASLATNGPVARARLLELTEGFELLTNWENGDDDGIAAFE